MHRRRTNALVAMANTHRTSEVSLIAFTVAPLFRFCIIMLNCVKA